MAVDLNKIMRMVKKGLRVKEEIDRLVVSKKRVYELSRILPDEEGYELIQIYEQSIKDIEKIMKVKNEKATDVKKGVN